MFFSVNRFKELLTKSFLDFKRPQFSLDLSLYFLNNIDPKIVKRRLRARMQILKKLSKGMCQVITSLENKGASPVYTIVKHNFEMINTEYEFLFDLIKTF